MQRVPVHHRQVHSSIFTPDAFGLIRPGRNNEKRRWKCVLDQQRRRGLSYAVVRIVEGNGEGAPRQRLARAKRLHDRSEGLSAVSQSRQRSHLPSKTLRGDIEESIALAGNGMPHGMVHQDRN